MRLTNGATVLRASINFEREVPVAVVLAKRGDHEFVTWTAYPVAGEIDVWDAEVGHYFRISEPGATIDSAYDDALGDFRARAR